MSRGRPCLLPLALSLVLAWVAPVSAGVAPIVTFHDLTDEVTATGNGSATVTGESVLFLPNTLLSNFPGFILGKALFITEGGCISGSCPVSDSITALTFSIEFHSDPEPSFGNVDCTLATCVAETGKLQDVTAFFFDQTVLGAPSSGLIFFESDVEAKVPAPATLLLLGLGLLALRRIRHRRV